MSRFYKKIFMSVFMVLICILAVPQSLQAAAVKPNARIRDYYVGTDSAGNYEIGTSEQLKLQAAVQVGKSDFLGTLRLRVRILNDKNKYVYQKVWRIDKSKKFTMNWNGKAMKKNSAKLPAKTFVEPGKYKVEFAIRYRSLKSQLKMKKWKTLKKKTVSLEIKEKDKEEIKQETDASQENHNTSGNTYFFKGATFTGSKYVDYIAEQIIREAGIKKGMSKDERVRRIYKYMLEKFKFPSGYVYELPVYYPLTSKKEKENLEAYYKKTKEAADEGRITISNMRNWRRKRLRSDMARRSANTDWMPQVFAVLCEHAGVKAGTCFGDYLIESTESVSGYFTQSCYWNYAEIGKNRYYYDINREIENYVTGQTKFYWYKESRETAEKRRIFNMEDVW